MIFAVALALSVLQGADSCARPELLPAYSHNDYNNRRPLLDALDRGYRGVEADLIRQGDSLIVAHDRRALYPSRTLARLYLEPLRQRLRRCGAILSDSSPFFLFIEVKESDERAFRLLTHQLREFEDLFGAVHVVLVGNWLPADSMIAQWPAYLKMQVSPTAKIAPFIRPGLITIDYGKTLRWDGQGPVPQQGAETLRQARRLSDSLHVPIRVHHVPVNKEVFRWLLAEGVTLIGVTDLQRAVNIRAF
jgi:hypothetical protein